MSPECLALYKEIYGCMHCSTAVSKGSVQSFVQPGPLQTLPISHFGNIASAKVWLVGTAPKGKRNDSNVGFLPAGFAGRMCLTDEQIEEAFEHFSGYFTRAGHDSFFDLWIKLLDGIELVHQPQTFAGGGICCVDLIKCPTVDSWSGVVRGPDKGLIYGCFLNDASQRYLKRQIEIHHPQILIFSAGLCGPQYYSNNRLANRDVGLRKLWPKGIKDICCGVWSFEFESSDQLREKETSAESQRCLSIGLSSDDKVRLNPNEIKKAIQDVIWSWEGFAGDTNGVL